MTTYFDSSAVIAIYVTEEFSARVRREVQAVGQIPFTSLHALEVRNAFRLLHGRGHMTAEELRLVSSHLEDDLRAQRLHQIGLDLFDVFERAKALSETHAARLLCRSLDILHVAAALELACTRFVSGDDRQLALGHAVGLKVVDIKKPARKTGRRAGPR